VTWVASLVEARHAEAILRDCLDLLPFHEIKHKPLRRYRGDVSPGLPR
jgi:hypothetical protein